MCSRLKKLRLCATATLLSVGFSASCASTERQPSASSKLRSAVESLAGYSPKANYDAVNTLFAAGREAIPALVEALESEADSSCHCGSLSRYSETITVDFDFDDNWEGHGRTVAEVALYLIEAILRSDIYFAQTCSLETDGAVASDSLEVNKRIGQVASSLRGLSASELERISVQDFERIMSRNGLGFPRRVQTQTRHEKWPAPLAAARRPCTISQPAVRPSDGLGRRFFRRGFSSQ